MMRRWLLVAAAAVGVFGELLLAGHELIDRYPYKVLTYPPAAFFEHYALVWAPVVCLVMFVGIIWSSGRWPLCVAILFPSVMPLALAGLMAVVTNVAFPGPQPTSVRNLDGYTVSQALNEFHRFCLCLTAVGLVGGLVSTGAVVGGDRVGRLWRERYRRAAEQADAADKRF